LRRRLVLCGAIALIALAGALLSAAGCSRSTYGVQIKGSDTMVNLVQAWAEQFMAEHPDISVPVTGGGSGTGVTALVNGTCEIAMSSRKMEPEETEAANHVGVYPVEYKVGVDGIAVVVNPANPISRLTIDQLRAIFTGEVTNWREVGGKDQPIVLLSREVNSGTHVYFKEHVLKSGDQQLDFSSKALMLSSSQALADEISHTETAIGYYGMGYLSKTQKAIAIAKDASSPYVEPTVDNVRAGKYAISRPLLMYTNGQPQGDVKLFMDFIFSPEGQKLVREQGFVPVK
jgi:phosphate transport system substrate-binding protein